MAKTLKTIYVEKYDIEVECEIEYDYPPYRPATLEDPEEGGCVTIEEMNLLSNDLDVDIVNYINDILFEDSDFIQDLESEIQDCCDDDYAEPEAPKAVT